MFDVLCINASLCLQILTRPLTSVVKNFLPSHLLQFRCHSIRSSTRNTRDVLPLQMTLLRLYTPFFLVFFGVFPFRFCNDAFFFTQPRVSIHRAFRTKTIVFEWFVGTHHLRKLQIALSTWYMNIVVVY